MDKCYFCSKDAEINGSFDKHVICQICGTYKITGESLRYDYRDLTDEQKLKASNYLKREKNKSDLIPLIIHNDAAQSPVFSPDTEYPIKLKNMI